VAFGKKYRYNSGVISFKAAHDQREDNDDVNISQLGLDESGKKFLWIGAELRVYV